MEKRHPLIDPKTEGAAFEIVNRDGASNFLLVCEHASNRIPASLNELGLTPDARAAHISWDLGAAEVAAHLSGHLDAALIAPRFSRLVHDCTRPSDDESAMPERVDSIDIPGNVGLSDAARQARIRELYRPFHDALASLIAARDRPGRKPIIVTIHTFTPVYQGRRRQLDLGILHDRDTRLADQVLKLCARDDALVTRRNQPYGPSDGVTHTLKTHALPRGLLNVMFELRNDLVADDACQRAMAQRLSMLLTAAVEDRRGSA